MRGVYNSSSHFPGTCKVGDQSGEVGFILETAFAIWNNDDRGYQMRGPLSGVWADGASTFVLGAHNLLERKELPSSHWAFPVLSSMALFDTRYVPQGTGETLVSKGSDLHHTLKRLKETGKSDSRSVQTHGERSPAINGSMLQKIILHLEVNGEKTWTKKQVKLQSALTVNQRVSLEL